MEERFMEKVERVEHIIIGYTRLVGLLGSPISHSKSPRTQNLGFARAGQDAVYLTFDVDNTNLEDAVKAMRTLNVLGFNVTMPNKQKVLPYLDELSEEARLIGAVNCVSNVNGVLRGYNTDGMGCVDNFREQGVKFGGEKVIIGGAGGAGCAVGVQMALSGVRELVVYDVIEDAAKKLAQVVNENVKGCTATGKKMVEADFVEELKTAALYVDCTSMGMEPYEGQAVISSAEQLPKDLVVCDITYMPVMTKLLQLAEERGCRYITGIGMMQKQAAAGFKIWTGVDMPMDYVLAVTAEEAR